MKRRFRVGTGRTWNSASGGGSLIGVDRGRRGMELGNRRGEKTCPSVEIRAPLLFYFFNFFYARDECILSGLSEPLVILLPAVIRVSMCPMGARVKWASLDVEKRFSFGRIEL